MSSRRLLYRSGKRRGLRTPQTGLLCLRPLRSNGEVVGDFEREAPDRPSKVNGVLADRQRCEHEIESIRYR